MPQMTPNNDRRKETFSRVLDELLNDYVTDDEDAKQAEFVLQRRAQDMREMYAEEEDDG